YNVSGYKPIALPSHLTWTEDPYQSKGWPGDIYSLTIFKDLLYAAETTHKQAYTDKLLQQIDGFLQTGTNQSQAWTNNNTVALRAIMLAEIWWNVRSLN